MGIQMLRQLATWKSMLLGHLILFLLTSITNQETSHWSVSLGLQSHLKWEFLGGIHDPWFASTGRDLLPWIVVNAKEHMIRYLPLTLGELANSTANSKAIAFHQLSLDSLTNVVLDNCIALDYLLAEQGVCAIANTTCCTLINISGKVEIQLHKIREHVH